MGIPRWALDERGVCAVQKSVGNGCHLTRRSERRSGRRLGGGGGGVCNCASVHACKCRREWADSSEPAYGPSVDGRRVRVEAPFLAPDNLKTGARSKSSTFAIHLQPISPRTSSCDAALRAPAHAPAWRLFYFLCPSLPSSAYPGRILLLDSQRRFPRTACLHRPSAFRTGHGAVPTVLPPRL
jgi:hypothetical protein